MVFLYPSLPYSNGIQLLFPIDWPGGHGLFSELCNTCIRCKYHNSSRCFYILKFEGVNELLYVFSSFSPGNFSTLSSNQVSPTLPGSLVISKNADLVLQKLSHCCTLSTSFLKDFAVRKRYVCCFLSQQQLGAQQRELIRHPQQSPLSLPSFFCDISQL